MKKLLQNNGNNERRGIWAAVFVYFIWGFTLLASKAAQEYASPFVLLAYRFDIAALILAIPAFLGRKKLHLKNSGKILALGLLEPCLYFIGEQYGVRLTNSAFSGVVIAMIPIVTLLLAYVILKERLSVSQWIFSILSIAGIVVITVLENRGGTVSFFGVLALLIAVMTGALYTVLNRKISTDYSVYERTFTVQLMGSLFFTVLALIENRNDLTALITPLGHADFVVSALFLAIFATVLAYTFFNFAIANAPTAKVVILCNMTTVISVLAGVLFLGESFSPGSAVAMAVTLIGIYGVQKT